MLGGLQTDRDILENRKLSFAASNRTGIENETDNIKVK
jgi:hypothetical protein